MKFTIVRDDKPVGLCCDHAGYELKERIKLWLVEHGVAVKDFGCYSADSVDYPDFAHPCGVAVENGEVYPAIAMCGSGNGIAMTLNKHQGVRAALCWDVELARLAREHNDANVLVLPARFIDESLALQAVEVFLNTEFEGGRHVRRVEKIAVK